MGFMWRSFILMFLGPAALLGVIFLFDATHAATPNASEKLRPIVKCQTHFGEKKFTLKDGKVAFHFEKDNGRSISSTLDSMDRRTSSGIKKTLYLDGKKHLISIKNVDNFNSHDDFLSITSQKGHKMTYPLNCQFTR